MSIPSTSNSGGNLYAIGTKILKKVRIVNKKLNITSPKLGKILIKNQNPSDAKTQPNIQAEIKLYDLIITEKSVNIVSL